MKPRERLIPRAAMRTLLGLLARWTLAWLCAWAWAGADAAPQAAALTVLQQAESRMNGLDAFRQRAHQVGSAAQVLGQAGKDAGSAWQRAQKADAEAGAAIQRADDCLPRLRKELSGGSAVMQLFEQAVAQSQQAVEAVAGAPPERLARVAADSDAAFRRRGAAERALADRQRRVDLQARDCISFVAAADEAVSLAFDRAHQFRKLSRALPGQLQRLRHDWSAATAAQHVLVQAQWLAIRAEPVGLPAGERIGQLERSLATPPVRGPAADLGPLRALGNADSNLQRIATKLTRLEDAATYIDAVVGPQANTCKGEPCRSFIGERRDLGRRIGDTRAALNAAQARWIDATVSLDTLMPPLQAALQGNAAALQPAAATLGPALDEAAAASRDGVAAGKALENVANTAYVQARREWEAAYRLAYGKPPPAPELEKMSTMAVMSSASNTTAKPKQPELRSHAYELFAEWDGEPRGFGTYTYVLIRSAGDLKSPGVRRRFRRLLDTLLTLPRAPQVRPNEAAHVNLFCIPSKTDNADDANADVLIAAYESALGQQIKLRAQNGLLTRKEISRRLIDSPGPFLITLPSRIAEASSNSPLLFADLSAYPDDAIADLAVSYMKGLLDDFPRQQAMWKPPVRQRVALVMIHLASGAGELVTKVLPTAQAQPP